jgi:hypothetical protein
MGDGREEKRQTAEQSAAALIARQFEQITEVSVKNEA